jgi:hypothetical protein
MQNSAKGAPKENVEVLQHVGELWSVDMMMKNMGEVLQSGVLQPAEVCFAQHHHCCIHLATPCVFCSVYDCSCSVSVECRGDRPGMVVQQAKQ